MQEHVSNYQSGIMYSKHNMLGPAIKSFKECCKYNEIDTHKAYYELSKIYFKLKDFDSAYEYCIEAIKLKPFYIEALYFLAHILKLLQTPLDELRVFMETYLSPIHMNYQLIADILYMEGYYELSLEYMNNYCKGNNKSDNTAYFTTKCLLRSCSYNKCIAYINTISENNLYYFTIMMHKILCLIIIDSKHSIWSIFEKFKYEQLSNYNYKLYSVYMQFYNIYIGNELTILCEDENDSSYTSCIFEICDILLSGKQFDLFEKALTLLNLISDKSVLLQLGKLYYRNGYIFMAKNELLRSISFFDVIDNEALDILLIEA
jgi:tetratricopeptide (TPR) repeat protein